VIRTIVAALALSCALSAGAQTLPPGPGKELVLTACVQCHDLRWIVSQKKSETGWRRTVNEMVWRGAPLIPGDVDVITHYLSTAAQSPSTAAASHDASKLPPGPGRNLVIAACVQCHDLGVTTSQRKTAEEWRRSVEQMAHLGAKLNGREIVVVAQYLAREFGK
jgi:mono/diheme cytochrome c family protein